MPEKWLAANTVVLKGEYSQPVRSREEKQVDNKSKRNKNNKKDSTTESHVGALPGQESAEALSHTGNLQPSQSLHTLFGCDHLMSGKAEESAMEPPELSYGSETEELVCFMAKQLLARDHEGG